MILNDFQVPLIETITLEQLNLTRKCRRKSLIVMKPFLSLSNALNRLMAFSFSCRVKLIGASATARSLASLPISILMKVRAACSCFQENQSFQFISSSNPEIGNQFKIQIHITIGEEFEFIIIKFRKCSKYRFYESIRYYEKKKLLSDEFFMSYELLMMYLALFLVPFQFSGHNLNNARQGLIGGISIQKSQSKTSGNNVGGRTGVFFHSIRHLNSKRNHFHEYISKTKNLGSSTRGPFFNPDTYPINLM